MSRGGHRSSGLSAQPSGTSRLALLHRPSRDRAGRTARGSRAYGSYLQAEAAMLGAAYDALMQFVEMVVASSQGALPAGMSVEVAWRYYLPTGVARFEHPIC